MEENKKNVTGTEVSENSVRDMMRDVIGEFMRAEQARLSLPTKQNYWTNGAAGKAWRSGWVSWKTRTAGRVPGPKKPSGMRRSGRNCRSWVC